MDCSILVVVGDKLMRHSVGNGLGGLTLRVNFSRALSFTQSPNCFKGNSGRDRRTSKSRLTVLHSPSCPRPTAAMKIENRY